MADLRVPYEAISMSVQYVNIKGKLLKHMFYQSNSISSDCTLLPHPRTWYADPTSGQGWSLSRDFG
jgi:hypothetical protein